MKSTPENQKYKKISSFAPVKTFLRILSYVFPYKNRIIYYAIFTILAIVFLAVSIALLQPVINLFFTGKNAAGPAFQITTHTLNFMNYFYDKIKLIISHNNGNKLPALAFAIVVIIIINIIGNVFKWLANYYLVHIRTKIIEDIRRAAFNKVLKLQIAFFEGERKGDIMTRFTSDLYNIETSAVITLESLFRDPLTILAFIFMMFVTSWKLTIFITILLPASALVITYLSKPLRRDSYHTQNILSWISSIIDEFIGGIRIVKGFNAESYVGRIFNKYNSQYSFLSRKIQNKQFFVPLISESMGVMTIAIFIWFGGRQVFNGHIDSAAIIVFVFYFQQIMKPAKNLSSAWGNIMKGVASGDRIFEILDAPVTITEKENAVSLDMMESGISIQDVTFCYTNEPVLKDINLTIPKGKIFAIVGPSGSGKTTLVELILRFYDISDGSIKIDGKDIRDIKLNDLRKLTAIVTQDPILFNDTIFNNIAFGMEGVSEEKVVEAAKSANAHDFIIEMENGYQSNVGDRGVLLSGGERQRISIARAILKNPPVLILDEATSSLDTNSEQIVQEALYKLMKNRTSIVIAHRLSTIQNADSIIVLDRGEIVEQGTHSELLAKNGLYKKLNEFQQLATN